MNVNDKWALDDDGNPVKIETLEDWAKWYEKNKDKRIVKKSYFKLPDSESEHHDVSVSTVFLSIDHNWAGGDPILFETMVFGGELDMEMERYHNRRQALAGHDEMVKAVLDKQPSLVAVN